MQVAATLGFVLGRRNGQFLKGLRPKEVEAIREILVWGAQPLNNKILGFYGSVLEKIDGACRKLMSRIKSVLPTAALAPESALPVGKFVILGMGNWETRWARKRRGL